MPGERFHVRLVPEEGGPSERVMVEVGMEGFNLLSSDGGRTLRKYPLHQISRWSMRGSSLILFTKSPVDVEDRTMTLQGDEHTIRSVLDTLTCCCMQMAELLQSGQGASDRVAANSLHALLKKSKKAATLPTADQVEFWKTPEKAGWMYSQGEHIKTWRKRWFVLKQGFLFRFSSEDVSPSSKPRGIVDLSQVTDVTDGNSATGRPNSIKLSTATVSKCYLTDSETAQVEWISALEGAVSKIVKIVAGVDDDEESAVPSRGGASSSRGGPASLEDQLRHSFSAVSGQPAGRKSSSGGGGGGGSGGGGGNQMVEILNYQPGAPSAPSSSRQHAGGSGNGYGGDYGGGYVNVDYGGGIAGAMMAPQETAAAALAAQPANFGAYGSIYSGPPSGGGGGYESYEAAPPVETYGGGGYASNQPYAAQPYQHQQQPQQQQHQQYPGYSSAPAAAEYGSAPPTANAPGGHTLMDAVTAPAAPPAGPSTPWQVHYSADGRPYYYNTATGITQWDAPAA